MLRVQRQQPALPARHEADVVPELDQLGFRKFRVQLLPHRVISLCRVAHDGVAIAQRYFFACGELR